MVVPEGILNSPGRNFIRSWLLKRSRIVASVGLPQTTFAASKGINHATLLIVRKFNQNEINQAEANVFDDDYRVFMCTPKTSGIDSRSHPTYLRQPDSQEITDSNGNKVLDDEIRGVAEAFREWL